MELQGDDLYRQRFAGVSQHKRAAMWQVVCRTVLQRYIKSSDTVVDLGAGSCEFINHIVCEHKVAIDTNPAVREHAGSEVNVIVGDIQKILGRLADTTVNVVFCSNFLEHLRDKGTVLAVLREVYRLLAPGGRLIVIQPNIRYAYKEYWDFFDHRVPLSHASLSEAVRLVGFVVEEVRPRFLPYTTKSRLPQAVWLVRLYLALRPAQWLLGKQMLLIARRPSLTPGESPP